MKSQNGALLAISADNTTNARKTAEKNDLRFPVLADEKLEAINAFGVVHRGGGPGKSDIALPAQFLFDRDGELVWHYITRLAPTRADAEELLARVRALAE